jgi:hypothetical protein
MATPAPLQEPRDFSLVLEGPLHRLLRRAHLSGSAPQLLSSLAAISILLCWVPLAILSLVQAHLLGGIKLSFARDIEAHVRFLVALPLLILTETLVRQRIREVARNFVERKVVIPEELPKFYSALNFGARIHNSLVTEIVLLVFVFTGGAWVWRHQIATDVASWYASYQGGHVQLTMAGYWLAFVSVPVFQFILLRWYLQFLIYFWFLFRVSRLKLYLPALHPDRPAGLAFVAQSTVAFAPLLFAQSAVFAAQIADRILYNGESLFASEMTIVGLVVFPVAAVLAPLLSFTVQLIRAKRQGIEKYGAFASSYVMDFSEKWLEGRANDEAALASGDIQSLADLGNSFAVARAMRPVPIGIDDIVLLLVVTIIPFVPLLLTIMPVDKLFEQAIKLVF